MIMQGNKVFERIGYFGMGLLAAFGILFLTGATDAPQVGRYQISTCLKRDWVHVYVIDTATGVVKFVNEKDEKKPFMEIN
jgi:hypothetical protein